MGIWYPREMTHIFEKGLITSSDHVNADLPHLHNATHLDASEEIS